MLTSCADGIIGKTIKVTAVGGTALAVTNPVSAAIITGVDIAGEYIFSGNTGKETVESSHEAIVLIFKNAITSVLIAYIVYDFLKMGAALLLRRFKIKPIAQKEKKDKEN